MPISATIPLTLYIHLPWCVRKCPYCDFNSHALKQTIPENEYIGALIDDLQQNLSTVADRDIKSIFFGGGTPSLFSPVAIEKLLKKIKTFLKINDDIEITLEANPGTVEQERFRGFKQAGINRLSIGIQSFQAEKLKILGRIHDNKDAINAIQAAKSAGFNNFNLDLMYGLPQQSVADALQDLKIAISMQPTHLSWYQLTLEPNTLFYQKPPVLPDQEHIWEMQNQGQALLAEHGFQQYEISAYSLPDYSCQHNLNYWEFGDYLGIGAGAHSKITDINSGKIKRIAKVKHPNDYLNKNKSFIAEEKIINQAELPLEFMMNALRLHKKISLQLFHERTGLTTRAIIKTLNDAKKMDLLTWNDDFLEVTAHGRNFLNNLLQLF